MITLSSHSVLYYRDDKEVLHFRPEFLEWCADEWEYRVTMFIVSWDRNPGSHYPNNIVYDLEVCGLTPSEETLWLMRWDESECHHDAILDYHHGREREEVVRPYSQYRFVTTLYL